MSFRTRVAALSFALSISPFLLQAQYEFQVAGRKVQMHSFVSQGFLYSNENNFLTLKTSDGSFAFTDGGINLSTNITDKFRVGAQMYLRKMGDLADGKPQLDWAYGDYRFKDWFGVRAGKVKTALGLYNDTQDLDFLNTWALLPQAIYPNDLRSVNIAHIGGDVYGSIPIKKLGTFSYTGYIGMRPHDSSDGYLYGLKGVSVYMDSFTGKQYGGDLRLQTRVPGLTVGASIMQQDPSGTYTQFTVTNRNVTRNNQTTQYYVQYQVKGLRIDGEYRRNWRAQGYVGVRDVSYDQRSWYLSAAYRLNKWLELGAYNSRYVANNATMHSLPTNHVFDWVGSARVDLNRHWNFKVEGHFMDGYAASNNAHGFYAQTNPQGLKPETNMLVVRTGLNF